MKIRNTSMKLIAAACAALALAISLRFAFNPVASAQQDGATMAATTSTEPEQAGPTIDDHFASVTNMVPSFGGFFIGEDGRLNVYLTNTSHLPAAMEAIVAVFGRDRLPLDSPVALQGRYNFTQLRTWHNAHRLTTLAMPGAQSVDIDERNNRLGIEVRDYDAQFNVRRELERLNIPAEAFDVSVVEPTELAVVRPSVPMKAAGASTAVAQWPWPTLRDQWRPIAGGIQIHDGVYKNGVAEFSTLGFLAVRNEQAGFVTCSHCTGHFKGGVGNTPFFQAEKDSKWKNQIGVESVNPKYFWGAGGKCPWGRQCRYSDAAFIKRSGGILQSTPLTPGDFGYLLLPDAYTLFSFQPPLLGPVTKYQITSVDYYSVTGDEVEKTGRTTGRTKGKVTRTCVDENASSNGNDLGVTMLCQNEISAFSRGGDSGAPVYSLHTSPSGVTGVRIHGILWGGRMGQSVSFFSPISQALWNSELGNFKVSKSQNPNSKPEVKIRQPLNGSKIPTGLFKVTFEADAVDYEDQSLTVKWTSDEDGLLGLGSSLPFGFTMPGVRHITASVKDSDGNEAIHKITITVENTPPTMSIVNASTPVYYAGVPYSFKGKSFDPNEEGDTLPCSSLSWRAQRTDGFFLDYPVGQGCDIFVTFGQPGDWKLTLTGVDSAGAKGVAIKQFKVQ